MIKKSIVISLCMFLAFFGITIVLQSCKPCKQKVCNFTFNVSDEFEADTLNQNLDGGIDTSLVGIHFTFEAFHETDNPACAWKSIGFSSVFAYTQDCKLINPIVSNSYWCSLDKNILFQNDTIKAGMNLFEYIDFKDHWLFEDPVTSNGSPPRIRAEGSVHLDTTISNQIQFDTGIYKVDFGFSTDDGQDMLKTLNVVYKL